MIGQCTMDIGKQGMTEGTITTLKTMFQNHKSVKIHVRKSAFSDRKEIKEIADKIATELGANYNYKIVGFAIFLKKFRKEQER